MDLKHPSATQNSDKHRKPEETLWYNCKHKKKKKKKKKKNTHDLKATSNM